jgi:hypothetical protein
MDKILDNPLILFILSAPFYFLDIIQKDFKGDFAVEVQIEGSANDPHAPTAGLLLNLVVREDSTDQRFLLDGDENTLFLKG